MGTLVPLFSLKEPEWPGMELARAWRGFVTRVVGRKNDRGAVGRCGLRKRANEGMEIGEGGRVSRWLKMVVWEEKLVAWFRRFGGFAVSVRHGVVARAWMSERVMCALWGVISG